jgi:hypothetical protein
MPNPGNIEPHKFKEGESGNPAGRPKGSRNLSTILKEMLTEEIEVKNEDGTVEKKQLQDVIVRKLITQATNKGNLRAIQEIFDRVEGKAKQEIKHEVTQGILNVDPISDVESTNDSLKEDSGA